MAKKITITLDIEGGTLTQEGALFLGGEASIEYEGYEQGRNPILALFQRRRDGLWPVSIATVPEGGTMPLLNLNTVASRESFAWCQKEHPGATVALQAYAIDGESLEAVTVEQVTRIVADGSRWIVAHGIVQVKWSPVNFEADGTMVSLKGKPGAPGGKGDPGADGLDAYQVAVRNGYTGTEQQWYATIASAAPSATSAANAKAGAEAAQAGAESANESAQAAKRIAESYAAQAGEEKAGAQQAKNEAQSLKSLAESAKEGAVAAKTAAQTAQGAAETAQRAAEGAKDLALGHRDDALSAKNDAVSAKNDAVSAKNDAASAKTNAEIAQGRAEAAAAQALRAESTIEAVIAAERVNDCLSEIADAYAEQTEFFTPIVAALEEV